MHRINKVHAMPNKLTQEGSAPAGLLNFDNLPNDAHVSAQVVAWLFGCSVPTVWRWSADGNLPKPLKIGPGCTRWRVGSLRDRMVAAA